MPRPASMRSTNQDQVSTLCWRTSGESQASKPCSVPRTQLGHVGLFREMCRSGHFGQFAGGEDCCLHPFDLCRSWENLREDSFAARGTALQHGLTRLGRRTHALKEGT